MKKHVSKLTGINLNTTQLFTSISVSLALMGCSQSTPNQDAAFSAPVAFGYQCQTSTPPTSTSSEVTGLRLIGTSVASYEAVPAAFGIMSMAMGDVWCAGLLAANIGDDTDTIGSIACAMCGAGSGMEGLNQNKIDELNRANDLDFDALSVALVDLRQGIGKLIRREAS